jgi:hypothetical protein
MNHSKLKEHLTSVQPANASTDAVFCANKAQFETAGICPKLGSAISQKHFLEPFYKVAYRAARKKKPHTRRDFSKAMCTGNGRAGL